MLKKAGHTVIILLLLAGTGGITISKHYCGNILVGRSIFSSPKDCCNGPCKDCRNEVKTLKIIDSYEFPDNRASFNDVTKTCKDLINIIAAIPVSGHDLTDLRPLYFPIKGPLIAKVRAGDPEAVLQCFRL